MQTELMRLARSAVTNALRRGDLIRPDSCSKCLNLCKPQAHHPDYTKPLEVIWLCKRCHTAEHYPNRPFKPISRKQYFKEYHAKNREKRRLEHIAYKAAHPEICAAAEKRWRKANKKRVAQRFRDWAEAHKSERAVYLKEYAKRKRDQINAKRRERRKVKS